MPIFKLSTLTKRTSSSSSGSSLMTMMGPGDTRLLRLTAGPDVASPGGFHVDVLQWTREESQTSQKFSKDTQSFLKEALFLSLFHRLHLHWCEHRCRSSIVQKWNFTSIIFSKLHMQPSCFWQANICWLQQSYGFSQRGGKFAQVKYWFIKHKWVWQDSVKLDLLCHILI